MSNSFTLFSVRGIDIRMHITFPLILIWSALQFSLLTGGGATGAAFGVVSTLLLFSIVVLHELGHSVAAQRYGVTVKQIVLLPIGGVAQLARIPEKPMEEFVIAIAGPMVNFVLAILLALVSLALGLELRLNDLPALLSNLGQFSLISVFGYVFSSNLFLGLFNLLPAFPMDGGRVLRAILASRMSYARATRLAVSIGQSLAWLLGLWGFLQGGLFLIVIAVFIYMGAGQEGQAVQIRSVLGGLTVEQAYSRGPEPLRMNSTLREAVQLTLNTFQSDFPICDGENLVGILTHARLVKALDEFGPDVSISQVMDKEINPVTPQDSLVEAQRRLMEQRLEALPVVSKGGRFMGLLTARDISEVYHLVSTRADILPVTAPALQE
ncbi:MAG: CBS domain-containing protein [Anaerolineales bacterium]|nr:CBS domain-containing protein [Anaerolineales bacterium]